MFSERTVTFCKLHFCYFEVEIILNLVGCVVSKELVHKCYPWEGASRVKLAVLFQFYFREDYVRQGFTKQCETGCHQQNETTIQLP